MNKIIITVVIIVVAVAAAGWWWMSRSESPSPTPAAQTNPDVEELNSINPSEDLDADFKGIDQDLNNL